MFKKSILIFGCFSFLLVANPVGELALYKAVFEEQFAWEDQVQPTHKMLPAQKVNRGTTLVYVNQLVNKSHNLKKDVVIKSPIPLGTAYVRGTSSCEGSCKMYYSLDDGKTFKKSEELFVVYGSKKRTAKGSEYTHIKYVFSEVPPMSKIRMIFKARVK